MNRLGITIDLDALVHNYHTAQKLSGGAETACVVKANAYGLGVEKIVPTLAAAGAKSFFVATPEEGAQVRQLSSNAAIYTFNGLPPGTSDLFLEYNLRPCLASLDEIHEWCAIKKEKPATALHVDTGINRLGLSLSDYENLEADTLQSLKPVLLMSHLSCADRPHDKMNEQQYQRLEKIRPIHNLPASLVNSAGLFLGEKFLFQMTRPGIALYGGDPLEDPQPDFPFEPVVYLMSHVAQTRTIQGGEKIGYGASFSATRETKIAIIPVGYADGYMRAAKNISVHIAGEAAPLVGRISMDMVIADITELSGTISRGTAVELLGAHTSLTDLARASGTIPHHIATGLGRRLPRHYIGGETKTENR